MKENKLHEANLTAQLMQYLTSKEPAQREIAIVALKESVGLETGASAIPL